MKFALVLLCVVAAVQGRSTSVQGVNNQRSVAALGENPWVLHIRLAVSTSGYLETGAAVLIDQRWALTSAELVQNIRFGWVRLGAVEVIKPELVLETSAVTLHSDWNPSTGANNIALINLNRNVDFTANIAPIRLPTASSNLGNSAKFCGYGETEARLAGEWLSCYDVTVIPDNDEVAIAGGQDVPISKYDIGAPFVSDGVLVGTLNRSVSNVAVITRTSAHVNWISGMTGIPVPSA